jgi:hypothetical protein
MVRLPWRADDESSDASTGDGDGDGAGGVGPDEEPVVRCAFQDGTIAVYEDRVVVERPSRSRFDDRTIPMAEIESIDLSNGITVGYLQVVQVGVEPDTGGLLSDPVNPNTVHFGRGGRDCAAEARDEILARASG